MEKKKFKAGDWWRLPAGPETPTPTNGSFEHDAVAYPQNTPLMEVCLSSNRGIIIAQTPQEFPRNYRQQGGCWGLDPSLFLPERGQSSEEAKRVCREECAVRDNCLEESLGRQVVEGVWGGTSKRERKEIKRSRDKALAEQNGRQKDGRTE